MTLLTVSTLCNVTKLTCALCVVLFSTAKRYVLWLKHCSRGALQCTWFRCYNI